MEREIDEPSPRSSVGETSNVGVNGSMGACDGAGAWVSDGSGFGVMVGCVDVSVG